MRHCSGSVFPHFCHLSPCSNNFLHFFLFFVKKVHYPTYTFGWNRPYSKGCILGYPPYYVVKGEWWTLWDDWGRGYICGWLFGTNRQPTLSVSIFFINFHAIYMFFRAVVNWAGDKSKGKQNSYDFAVDLAKHFKYQHTDWICNMPPTKDQMAKQKAE